MSVFSDILAILSVLAIFFLVFPALTVMIAFFKKEKLKTPAAPKLHDFACVITAYKNFEITKPLIQSLLNQQYEDFHIYLVADGASLTDFDIENKKLTVLNPDPSLNLKVKSIIYALDHAHREHDFVVIFDGDNLAHPDFLQEINRYANAGFLAIQGQRTAKNLDTKYAAMDALGEFYKNYIERYVTYLLGSSAVISGSGMAVEANLYRGYLQSPEIETGKNLWKKMLQEDKILQNFLLRQNQKIAYARKAVCYDEKVTSAQAVETQRSRWLFSYFQNIPNVLGILRRAVMGFSWNQLYFGLITIAPPMFISLFSAVLLLLINWFVQPLTSLLLLISMTVFALNILLTLRLSGAPRAVWEAVASLPLFVLKQITALLKIGNPNKNFKHTEHTRKVSIDEVLSQKL